MRCMNENGGSEMLGLTVKCFTRASPSIIRSLIMRSLIIDHHSFPRIFRTLFSIRTGSAASFRSFASRWFQSL